MTDAWVDELDLETPDSVQVRFGISCLQARPAEASVTLRMPMEHYRNPFTGAPTLGPLAILVDAAAGVVNHYRHRRGQWTVSSELSMELSLGDVGDLAGDVVATAHAPGPLGVTSLGICTLTYGGNVIGGGTVRSFFIDADGDVAHSNRLETLRRSPDTSFTDLMGAFIREGETGPVLSQGVDDNLNNDIHMLHGGVAAAGLELAASAALNLGRPDGLLQTASLRVNFLRPFITGAESRYEGTVLRAGRNTAVGDARAIGADGRVALAGRVTAYR